jgi:CubicO group peptidase (beta-lactamase class C family)
LSSQPGKRKEPLRRRPDRLAPVIADAVAPGFESVRDAFQRCFADLGETGAAYVALVDGRPVADRCGGDGVTRESLVHVYSVTKPMVAFCVLVLVDRGLIGLEDTVAKHWPEFGQVGKEHVTVRHVLSHEAGLVALRDPQPTEVLLDWDRTCGLLATERTLVCSWYRAR